MPHQTPRLSGEPMRIPAPLGGHYSLFPVLKEIPSGHLGVKTGRSNGLKQMITHHRAVPCVEIVFSLAELPLRGLSLKLPRDAAIQHTVSDCQQASDRAQ